MNSILHSFFPVQIIFILFYLLSAFSGEQRKIEIHGVIETSSDDIVFPKGAEAVIDVTKPPYNADNSGGKDCTMALNKAYDAVMTSMFNAFLETVEMKKKNPSLKLTREGKPTQVLFPMVPSKSYILYFPKGTYKVSNTIVYSMQNLQNTQGMELNRQIHFVGENQQSTIIQLTNNAKGFEQGNNKPVVSFMQGAKSNVAMSNTFENFTINTGDGNPGATGLLFHSSNNGAVRNVTIQSGDQTNSGHTGLAITKENPMGLFKNITVNGFDYGIRIDHFKLNTVYEHITLTNQKKTGFYLLDNPASIRGLVSNNTVPAIKIEGKRGYLVLIDSELKGRNSLSSAIELNEGYLFARNVNTTGYATAVKKKNVAVITGSFINEYCSEDVKTLFDGMSKRSLSLPIEETPQVPLEKNMDQWISVNKYGAKGDGHTDDTKAIQAALNSGKSTIYFNPGRYFIDGMLII